LRHGWLKGNRRCLAWGRSWYLGGCNRDGWNRGRGSRNGGFQRNGRRTTRLQGRRTTRLQRRCRRRGGAALSDLAKISMRKSWDLRWLAISFWKVTSRFSHGELGESQDDDGNQLHFVETWKEMLQTRLCRSANCVLLVQSNCLFEASKRGSLSLMRSSCLVSTRLHATCLQYIYSSEGQHGMCRDRPRFVDIVRR
jgi:hypothetical protein